MMTTDLKSAEAGQVSTSAAEVYDEFFVPALFGEWAAPLCSAADLMPGQDVLDVACGTGATTRAARSVVGDGGSVVGIDRNDGMLAVARRRAKGIRFVQARAEALPFEASSFDRALCQFGLMFFDDRAEALREMTRVLRVGGRAAVSVWDTETSSPGYDRMIGLIERLFGQAPADALRAPFSLGDEGTLKDLADSAGIVGAHIETRTGTARFPSITEWVRMDVRGWTLSDMIDDRGFADLVAAAERECADFADPGGAVSFPAPAHILSWRKPA